MIKNLPPNSSPNPSGYVAGYGDNCYLGLAVEIARNRLKEQLRCDLNGFDGF
jgi:hypothetical protein